MPCIEKSSLADTGVSVVVPVLNGARWLPDVLAAIRAELAGSTARDPRGRRRQSATSRSTICRRGGEADVQVVDGPRRGAAAAVNVGLRLARFDLVAQIDQDVIVQARLVRDPHRRARAIRAWRRRKGGTSPTRRPPHWRA